MARSKGEGSIYYIEKRKKWSAQYTITVGDKQVRKTVYGNTKREVADKLLDLRAQMKDIDLIKEHGMSIIQIMKDIRDNKLHEEKYLKEKMEDFYGFKEMNQLPIVQLMNMKIEEQAKKQIYLEELTQKLEKIEKSMDSTMESIKKYTKELSAKMYKIEIMETDITNLIKETQELSKKLRIQVKLKYMAIGIIVSAIISILIIILK